MAALFAGGVVLFVIARAVLVPKGFGLYGHYRAGALADNRSQPLVHAGRAVCGDCHTDKKDELAGGKHAGVGCEACHGALARHAEDPSVKPARPEPKTLCVRCHLANVAKPKKFPQIEVKTHFDGGDCHGCHASHAPNKEPKS
jgi:formate-dependent nitrite reductase cytochrome c552 subunit